MAENFKPRVVIFLGAGVCKPLDIPTSGEFFIDKCFEKFKEKSTFLKIAEELGVSPESADLEKILIKIENSRAVVNDAIVVNKGEAEARVRLGDEIHNSIYQKCSAFNQKKCFDHYSGLFINLRPHLTSHVAIFTTNYDRTLEFYFRKQTPEEFNGAWCRVFNEVRLWDGFVKVPEGGLVWREWGYGQQVKEKADNIWDIPLYKMHGSLGWIKKDNTVVEISNEIVNRTGYPPLLVFPGVKGVPDHEICRFTRDRLREELENADCAVVMGFSFRDDYIAEIFEQALARNKKLNITAIMPGDWSIDSKVKDYRTLQSRIEKLNCCFGNTPGQKHVKLLHYDIHTKQVRPTRIES
jgi:NAD-dependent SIR2 family protein deacetylase